MLQEFILKDLEKEVAYEIVENKENETKINFFFSKQKIIEVNVIEEMNMIFFETSKKMNNLTEEDRMKLTMILDSLRGRMRFAYKNYYFIMPYEYITNKDVYEKRARGEVDFQEINEVLEKVEKEHPKTQEMVALEIEEKIDDIRIFAIGKDAKKMLDILKEKRVIDYKKLNDYYYEVDYIEKISGVYGKKEKVFKMLALARELKKIHYNVYVNYKND